MYLKQISITKKIDCFKISKILNEGIYDLKGTAGYFNDNKEIAVHTPVVLKKFYITSNSTSAPAGTSIELSAYLDIYKDGVLQSHSNITAYGTTWNIVSGGGTNTTLTGTSPKYLKKTATGTVVVGCTMNGASFSYPEMGTHTVSESYIFTGSSVVEPKNVDINFQIVLESTLAGGIRRVYAKADRNVPCDVKIQSMLGDEYIITAGNNRSETKEIKNGNLTVVNVGTASTNGAMTRFFDPSTNTYYSFKW